MRSLPSDKVLVDVLRSMLEGSYIRRDLLELDNLVLAGDLTPHLVLTRLWLPTCRCLRLLYLVLQPTNIRVIHEHLKGSIPTPSLALVLPINSSFTDCFVRNHSLGMLTDQWPSQVLRQHIALIIYAANVDNSKQINVLQLSNVEELYIIMLAAASNAESICQIDHSLIIDLQYHGSLHLKP